MKKLLQIIFLLFVSSHLFAQNGDEAVQKAKADSLFDAKEYSKAVKIYQKLLEISPKDTYLLCNAGNCYFRLKKYQQAKEKFRLATLYCDPDKKENMAVFYTDLGAVCSDLGEENKYFEYSMKAYTINPTLLTLWNATSACNAIGKYRDALNLLNNSSVEKSPGFSGLYGMVYVGLNNYPKSIENFENFLTVYQDDSFVDFVSPTDIKERLFNSYVYQMVINAVKNDSVFIDNIRVEQLYGDVYAHNSESKKQNSLLKNICIINAYSNSNNSIFTHIFDKYGETFSSDFKIDWLNAIGRFDMAEKLLKSKFVNEKDPKKQRELQSKIFENNYAHYLIDLNRGNMTESYSPRIKNLKKQFSDFMASKSNLDYNAFNHDPEVCDFVDMVVACVKSYGRVNRKTVDSVITLYQEFPQPQIREAMVNMIEKELTKKNN